jgi:hypothetical protein
MIKYIDLTIDQRISLKGEFETSPIYTNYKAIMLLWNFVVAVEYFLNDDIFSFNYLKDLYFNTPKNR